MTARKAKATAELFMGMGMGMGMEMEQEVENGGQSGFYVFYADVLAGLVGEASGGA
jgi:hypothetical protein